MGKKKDTKDGKERKKNQIKEQQNPLTFNAANTPQLSNGRSSLKRAAELASLPGSKKRIHSQPSNSAGQSERKAKFFVALISLLRLYGGGDDGQWSIGFLVIAFDR